MTQLALRMVGEAVPLDLEEVRRQSSGARAIALCAQKSGRLDKIIAADIGAQEANVVEDPDQRQGFSLEQLSLLMDTCGNEAPLHWLLLHRGYDPRTLRKLESQTERELREAQERIAQLERDKRVLTEAPRGTP